MKKTWSDQELITAVKTSNTYADVGRKLGLTNYGANSKTIKKYIKILNLDISHFLSRSEQLKLARKEKTNLSFDEIFNINKLDRKFIKNKIIKENLLPYKCNKCSINTWNNLSLSLHLDHINGNPNDNRLENLRFLCPNCHSQTETYCGKKLTNILFVNHCLDCGQEIKENSKKCQSCSRKSRPTKIIWPPLEEVSSLVNKYGYQKTGRILNVSGNSVKKFMKNKIT